MPLAAPPLRRTSRVGLFLASLVALLMLCSPAAAWALAADDLPAAPPAALVLDQADVLSRAGSAELERRLKAFAADHVEARLITISRLDYGLSIDQLAESLLTRWSSGVNGATNPQLLLLLFDAQTRSSAVVASPSLERQLPPELLESTARTTMTLPLREGDRYRQAGLDALTRLGVVLGGGEDPGEPVEPEQLTPTSNIPSREETQSSNAFTWVVVLLVVGSIVPMLTWWVFSR